MKRVAISLAIGFGLSTLLFWLGGADCCERGPAAVGWLVLSLLTALLALTCPYWREE